MKTILHKNARTTPAIRREIKKSDLSVNALAKKYNLSRNTVKKWKEADSVEDKSSRPKLTCCHWPEPASKFTAVVEP